MDKKLNKITETYLSNFKNHIKDLILREELEQSKAARTRRLGLRDGVAGKA